MSDCAACCLGVCRPHIAQCCAAPVPQLQLRSGGGGDPCAPRRRLLHVERSYSSSSCGCTARLHAGTASESRLAPPGTPQHTQHPCQTHFLNAPFVPLQVVSSSKPNLRGALSTSRQLLQTNCPAGCDTDSGGCVEGSSRCSKCRNGLLLNTIDGGCYCPRWRYASAGTW